MQIKTKEILERKEDRGRKELVMNFDVFMTLQKHIYVKSFLQKDKYDKRIMERGKIKQKSTCFFDKPNLAN